MRPTTATRRAGRQHDGTAVSTLLDEADRAERAGQRELARRRYESALYLLRSESEAEEASLILRRVGRLYLDDGDVESGLDCVGAALAVAEAHGDSAAIANAKNIIAISHWQRGQLDEAEALYLEAGRVAQIAGDARLVAMVEQNLGVIASMRGDVPLALRHYRVSLAGYRALGLDTYVANLLNDIGLAYADLARWDDAESTYQEALALCEVCGDASIALMVDVNRAAMRIARGDYVDAQVVCERVLQEARPLNDVRVLSEVYKHCGVIARELGRAEEAEEYLRVAYESALRREDLLLAAESAREQAELYTTLRRHRDALQALNASHRLFARLRLQRDVADVRRRSERLERRFLDVVRQWGQSIESKDRYTLGHCERVADYTCAMAKTMGFDDQTLFWMRIGALLHDVGKLVVPSDILNKAAPLTPAERSIMERHASAGADLLKDVEFPWDVLPMIRHHHERWDGAGYPSGLSGDAIPISARILCVADVYDALTTHRPYRAAYSPQDALEAMRADRERVFDPDVLDRFARILESLPASRAFPSPVPLPEQSDKGPDTIASPFAA
ncbi:MAG TPA: HD domain-containing phosphohydrolase [Gemmatimonadaceae bacterium]|jgi:putative nucleotidyltransferase with HDIG domain